MAYKPTLITPQEVKELSKETFLAPCDINDIRQVETTFARECLGLTLYASLVNDLADYTTATEWSGGTVTTGTVKSYQGVYYKAKVNTTNEPTLKSDWELAPKFATTANNDLWCNVLGRHLALLVLQSTMTPISIPTTRAGNARRNGTGYTAADGGDNLTKWHWVASQLVGSFDNLEAYLVANSFNYQTCQTNTCCVVDEHYLAFSDGEVYIGHQDTSPCACGKCRAKLLTATNRYIIA